MKRTIALLALIMIPVLASANDIKKGDVAKVPSWTWVDVKNVQPVKSGNTSFSYGEHCGVQHGGTVTVLGVVGDRVLVRYSIADVQYGTPCPSGIVFFTTKGTFSAMTAEYHRINAANEREKNLVAKLSKK